MGNASVHPTHLSLTLIDNKNYARKMLADAEEIDFYVHTCREDPANAKARRALSYDVNSMTHNEVVHYQHQLNEMIPRLPKRLQMDLPAVYLLPLMPSADGGMPHTRPSSLICVPRLSHMTSLSTMTHELWHVHQRMYKTSWATIFGRLRWTEWKGDLPTFLEKNRRLNPDTIDSPLWVFQDTWVPVPVFQDIARPNVTEVDIWFYHATEDYHIKSVPAELGRFFSGLPHSAYEHPRELTAYLLADHEQYRETPARAILLSLVGNLAISS